MSAMMIVTLECVREERSGAGWRSKCGESGLSWRDSRSVLHPNAGLAEAGRQMRWEVRHPGISRSGNLAATRENT